MLSKKSQLHKSGKIKEQGVKDSEYLNDLKQMTLRCIVCGEHNTELHHVYSVLMGVKRSDHRVLPLCEEHHRGSKCSPHGNKSEFKKLFSFEDLVLIADRIRENYLKDKNV